jgi:iron complex transport system substrate-binding protein
MTHRSPLSASFSAGNRSSDGLGRRGFLVVIGGGLAAAAVSGCTNSSLDDPAEAENAPTPSGSGTEDATAAAFPVTVNHRFGETTIPAEPQRIVALGQTDCDPLIALGITPLAIGSFADDWYNPVHPWNEDGFGDETPQELSFIEIEFETIAALQPDLITMVSGGISKGDYETLSKIAPVVGPPDGYTDSAVPYGPHTVLIGQAVGKEAEAQQIVADVDAAYAAVREAHPEWASLNAVHAEAYTGAFYVLGKNAPRTTFLTSSGFTLSPELDEVTGNDYQMEISAEQLDLVGDLDLVVWCTDPDAIPDVQGNPVVEQLASTKNGTSIWMTYDKNDQFMWAMDWNTVLSGPYAIEHGVPLVEAALAGESPLSAGV